MRVIKTFSIFSFCLMLFSGLAGVLSPASAQQQEKRIALVVGNGAYAKSPLATAANDAGLIAQTLQAAGFDVIGARDLDGDTLRRSFRDFIQKAEASGPDTVAMVYLAGYGMQLAGENYFIPVDSTISRDTDIPTEGMRISDYVRQLASLPLKAGVVVLDAARQQPFIEGGQPLASGLALVEPDRHMLIAFNAAPGTIAPAEQGPYGVYAQSLAEMIRTGGLPLPEVFNRVRLRVNEASKGAQVPWDAQKIDAQFMFFDRAPDAPAQPPQDQAATVRNRPNERMPAALAAKCTIILGNCRTSGVGSAPSAVARSSPPATSAKTRGLAVAIVRASSTAPGSSIIGTSDIALRPMARSMPSSKSARAAIACASRAFGTSKPSAPARQAAWASSRMRAGSELIRTNMTAPPRRAIATASPSRARAASFWAGATASSRSRMIASAPRSWALARNRSELAGT